MQRQRAKFQQRFWVLLALVMTALVVCIVGCGGGGSSSGSGGNTGGGGTTGGGGSIGGNTTPPAGSTVGTGAITAGGGGTAGTTSGGIAVNIPGGAIPANTGITLTLLSPTPAADTTLASGGYACTPTLTLAKPATVQIPYSGTALPGYTIQIVTITNGVVTAVWPTTLANGIATAQVSQLTTLAVAQVINTYGNWDGTANSTSAKYPGTGYFYTHIGAGGAMSVTLNDSSASGGQTTLTGTVAGSGSYSVSGTYQGSAVTLAGSLTIVSSAMLTGTATATTATGSATGNLTLIPHQAGTGVGHSVGPPNLTQPTAPASTTLQAALSSLQLVGLSISSVTSAQAVDSTGAAIPAVTSSTNTPSAIAQALATAAGAVPSSTPIALPQFQSNGTVALVAISKIATDAGQAVTLATLQQGFQTYFIQLQAMAAGQGTQVVPGDKYVIDTYTYNGQQYASPGIVDVNGNLVFDPVVSLLPPAGSDTKHEIVTVSVSGIWSAGNAAYFNPGDGHLVFLAQSTAQGNVDSSGNLISTNPATVTNLPPVLGPGISQTTSPAATFTANGSCYQINVATTIKMSFAGITMWSGPTQFAYPVCSSKAETIAKRR